MSTWYVDPVNGLNTNNGLGPDASDGTNKPFQTVAKLIASGGSMASGDVAYLGPGIYREAGFTIALAPTAETKILGDPLNKRGFKTAAGVRVAADQVLLTGWTTNDTTACEAVNKITAVGKNYFTWEDIVYIGNTQFTELTSGCRNWTLRRCVLHSIGEYACFRITPVADTPLDLLIENCVITANNSGAVYFRNCPSSASADWDLNVVVRNSKLIAEGGGSGLNVAVTGTGSFWPGGINVLNCTIFANSGVYIMTAGKFSLTIPCTVYGCKIFGVNLLFATTLGQIVEDYNLLLGKTARVLVDIGANSHTTDRASYHDMGQSLLHGFGGKPFLSPYPLSRALGFGGSSPPATDLWGRPRPSGSGLLVGSVLAAVGAMECHDFGVESAAADADGGVGAALLLTGPGDHDIVVGVNAESTTLTIKVKFDSATYGGTDYPQVILLDATDIGVATETEVATVAASDAYETLTFTAFTPTRKSFVKLRLINRSTAAAGKCWFDTLG